MEGLSGVEQLGIMEVFFDIRLLKGIVVWPCDVSIIGSKGMLMSPAKRTTSAANFFNLRSTWDR